MERVSPFDRNAYKHRNLIDRAFGRIKDWRRIATRYDKLARNFLSAAALARRHQLADLIESGP